MTFRALILTRIRKTDTADKSRAVASCRSRVMPFSLSLSLVRTQKAGAIDARRYLRDRLLCRHNPRGAYPGFLWLSLSLSLAGTAHAGLGPKSFSPRCVSVLRSRGLGPGRKLRITGTACPRGVGAKPPFTIRDYTRGEISRARAYPFQARRRASLHFGDLSARSRHHASRTYDIYSG